MLYLIGGAPRAGKTILARRILARRRIAYFPLDMLMSGIAAAVPQWGIKVPDPPLMRAEPMRPMIRAMAVNAIGTGDDYVLEGDMILPAGVAELQREHPSAIRACFLGYASIDAAAKMSAIRRYAAAADWTRSLDDAYLLKLIGELRGFSAHLRDESARHGLGYFDESVGFAEMLDRATAHLFPGPG